MNSEPRISSKHALFVEALLAGKSATQAAIQAGYAPSNAASTGSRLIRNANIRAELQRRREMSAEQLKMGATQVVSEWVKLVRADPREIVTVTRVCCRYCYGQSGLYQWRTPEEYEEALACYLRTPEKARSGRLPPTNEGGYGYRSRRKPNEECPNCEGEGQPEIMLRDFAQLSPNAIALLDGVKQTRFGLEVKFRDRDAALANIARHLGMFDADSGRKDEQHDPLTALIKSLQKRSSTAPIMTGKENEQ
ncbi:terminase small subunit [Planktotalea arctica]|uniref:terminase small subunit n=1 Tax=Planktotalea arctica TaxID=1481893 RepID=UPI00321A41A9